MEATDPEGQRLIFRFLNSPPGMTIDQDTGVIRWVPASDQVGSFFVQVTVVDTLQYADTQTFVVEVPNDPPEIVSAPSSRKSPPCP